MKKLVTTGLRGGLLSLPSILVAALLVFMPNLRAQQNCVMSCPPMDPPVEISLSSACHDVVTAGLIGVVAVGCTGELTVDILVNGVSIGDEIDADMIGQTFMVIVSNPASGQSCMSMIKVVDKQAPLVNCPDDVTFECTTDLSLYNPFYPGDISDCSEFELSIDDDLVSSGQCVGNIISVYDRTYTIQDAYDNITVCNQTIALKKASLTDVVFPPSLTGPNALNCSPPPDTMPEATGYPKVHGSNILNGSVCNLSAVYNDLIFPHCSGSYVIQRTWTVIDWCNNNQSSTSMQVIEVVDHTPPVVAAPADLTVSTANTGCTADVLLPPAQISIDCSDSYSVRMEGPFGTIHSNGGLVTGLPKGVHRIIYKATNDCGLEGKDTMYLTVQDLVPPTPVCVQFVAIPVNQTGTVLVPVSVFNGGSADNCSTVYFKARRMTTPSDDSCLNPGNPNNQFDDFIQLCCADIPNNNVMVIFRVYDQPTVPGPVSDTYLQGHFNDCMVQVQVQDKLPPQLICPSNITVSCQFPYTEQNLNVFGKVVLAEEDRDQICVDDPAGPNGPDIYCLGQDGLATDNCNVEVEELDPVININNCGAGTITRTFQATDAGGLQTTCQQVITVVNYNLFSEYDITWPEDLTTTNICEVGSLDPEDLQMPYREPILADGPCDLVGATHHDDLFEFSGPDQACFKILRTWTVIDWCQLNTPTIGKWTHIQVIKVMNTTPPQIDFIADRSECSFDPNCGGVTLDFDARAEDDCSSDASLTWKYFVDLQNNNTFDYVSGEITGGVIHFSHNLPIGSHRIVYTVWDRCGNSSTEEQSVTIKSCKAPSAKCIHGLSTNLMAMDTDGDGTADWGMVNLQAQMFDAGSSQPCGNTITFAFSADPADDSRVFDCGDVGEQEVELWVIDQNGLTDFCVTTVEIQDNNHICPPDQGGTGIIAGNISVPGSGQLTGAMVYLDGSNLTGIPSGLNGHFVFPSMPLGGTYVVRPEREGDARNGVTTLDLVKIQKHLLGLETFTTPYQLIAADVNNSSSISAIDIIQLRKLILGFYDVFPSNKSWRFIEKGHVFPDPTNPWASPWPETYSIIPFSANMNDVDFDAVKIGDLNHSASLQAGNGDMIIPRSGLTCEIEYTVHPQPDGLTDRIDIYMRNPEIYSAIQFTFGWDQTSFKMLDWSPGEAFTSDDFRMPEAPDQNASMAGFTIDGWKGDKLLLASLWVDHTAAHGYPFQLFLNPAPTMPLAFTPDADAPVNVQLVRNTPAVASMDNRPNPFSDMTTIRMVSLRDEDAMLRVFETGGKCVMTRKVTLVQGENEFVVRKSELKGAGIYMYEIESDFQYSTNRMIIVD